MSDDSGVAVKQAQKDPGDQPAVATRQRSTVLRIARLRDLALIPAIVLIGAVGVYVSPVFLTRQNLTNILQQQSEISLVVLGEAMILIAGRLDLSLESTVGLAPGVACWLILPKSPYHGEGLLLAGAWGIPISLAVGVAIGVLNGLLIVRFKLHGFIVTLGMLITLRGLLNGISQGQTFFGLPKSMTYLGQTEWLNLPASVWVSLILFAIGIFVLGYTRIGRSLYAIGGNASAAKAAGIRVDRVVHVHRRQHTGGTSRHSARRATRLGCSGIRQRLDLHCLRRMRHRWRQHERWPGDHFRCVHRHSAAVHRAERADPCRRQCRLDQLP
jgi:simple sugar transport system permease protein